MASHSVRLAILLLLLLTWNANREILGVRGMIPSQLPVAKGGCPPPPLKERTKPFQPWQTYPQDFVFRYSCIDGFVRKAGTSTQIICKRHGNTFQWDNISGSVAIKCIPDPRREKTTQVLVTPATTTSPSQPRFSTPWPGTRADPRREKTTQALWNETGPEAGAATSTAEHKMTKMTAATEAKSTDWTSLVTITSTVRLTAVTASPDPTVKSSCTTTDLATSVPEVFPDPATSATQSSAPDKASVNGTRKATNASIPIGAGSCAGIIILIMLAVVGAVTLKRRRGQRSAEMPELQKEQVSLTHAEPLPSHDREQYTTVAEHDQ